MRKLVTLFLLLAMLTSFAGIANAAETGIALSDSSGRPGDTVYLAVSLNAPVTGDSIGISYSYDSAILEAIPASCSWSGNGVLQDFDNHNQGVWTAGKATQLTGTLCVLAFRIRPNVTFTSTAVSCTVSILHNGKEVANHNAQASVSFGCSHEYGNWANAGSVGHSRVCSLCQNKQTQSHTWDNGIVKENAESTQTNWMVYTCSVCGAENRVDIPKENAPSTPTSPSEPQESLPPIHTAPTEPEENNRPSNTQPTNPNRGENSSQGNQGNHDDHSDQDPNSGNSIHDYNDSASAAEEHDHTHSHDSIPEEETSPLMIPSNQDPQEADPHSDHNHEESVRVLSKQEQRFNRVLVFVILAAMFGTGAYFLKKKKK